MLSISLGLNIHAGGVQAAQSLLDLTSPISTGTANVWSQGVSTRTSSILTDIDTPQAQNNIGQGGWSFQSEIGASYEIDFDVTFDDPSATGTYCRVSPDDTFAFGSLIANAGVGSDVGTLSFTGTGNELWVGSSLITDRQQVFVINKYFLRKV